jgi:hypothetical protein
VAPDESEADTELVYTVIGLSNRTLGWTFHEKTANDYNRDYCDGLAIIAPILVQYGRADDEITADLGAPAL